MAGNFGRQGYRRRTAAQRVKAAQLPEKQQPLKTDAERARARATRKAKLKWKGDDELHEVRSYIPAAAPPSAGLHGDGLVVAIGDPNLPEAQVRQTIELVNLR